MQRDLFGSSNFSSIKHGTRHYVAALQNKAGELTALATASPDTWGRLTPLIHVVGPKNPRVDGISIEAVRSWAKKIATAVKDRTCFVDLVRLRAGALTRPPKVKPAPTTRQGNRQRLVLECIYQAARRRGVNFVPVLPVGTASEVQVRLVRDAVEEDGRGIALRYPLLSTVSLDEPENLMLRSLAKVGEDPENADLILDLAWISPDTELEIDLMTTLIDRIADAADWRNVVLLGTSMPSSLKCVSEGTLDLLPRREWQCWSEVNERIRRQVVFGDYGIQHPNPPHDSGPGMRANIRYTTDEATLVARGEGAVVVVGNEQYRELCRKLVARPEYLGSSYSWGDLQIQKCADGILAPGSQNLWRAVGTSHHLRFVTEQVRNRNG